MKNDKYKGLTKEVYEMCQIFDLYRENNPIHLDEGQDFIPKLSTDTDHEYKPRLTTKPGV